MANLWEAALDEVQSTDSKRSSSEKTIIVVGGKSSGKSTFILKFLQRDEIPKATIALEYLFARKSGNAGKLTSHLWELGGGTNLIKLLDVPITAQTLKSTTLCLTLDLSKPNSLIENVEILLNGVRQRIDSIIRQHSKSNPTLQNDLMSAAWNRVGGKEKTDSSAIQPFLLPLVIIGSKYDVYQNMEPDDRKAISRFIRILALTHGAAVIFASSKMENTMKGLRHVINALAFDGKLNQKPVIDSKSPLYVPFGSDSLQNIFGSADRSSSSRNLFEMSKTKFSAKFPPKSDDAKKLSTDDPSKDKQFAESKIDDLKLQKERELEILKRQENQRWSTKGR